VEADSAGTVIMQEGLRLAMLKILFAVDNEKRLPPLLKVSPLPPLPLPLFSSLFFFPFTSFSLLSPLLYYFEDGAV